MTFVCTGKQTDGFGAQFQNIISAIVYSEIHNLEYVHRPITDIEHNYHNDPEFVNRINECMNIDKKYRTIDKVGRDEKEQPANFKKYFDQNFEKCYNSEALKKFRKKYRENKKPKEHYLPEDVTVHISVHVRRSNPHDSRKTPNHDGKIIDIIKQLNQKYIKSNTPHHFYIISQGNEQYFNKFTSICSNMTLCLNELPEIAFHRMVISDILITAVSSFSYTAALLSNGAIIYKTFWHTGSKKWIDF